MLVASLQRKGKKFKRPTIHPARLASPPSLGRLEPSKAQREEGPGRPPVTSGPGEAPGSLEWGKVAWN